MHHSATVAFMAEDDSAVDDTTAGPAADDDTVIVPDYPPTEAAELAWSAEQSSDDSEDLTPRSNSALDTLNLMKAVAGLVFWALVIWITVSMCSSSGDKPGASTDMPTSTSVTPSSISQYQTMPGDGTYSMGGIDGKDWGVWQSTGGAGICDWSVRAVNRYTAGRVFDSGEVGPNTPTRVSIQPLGDTSSITGEGHGSRLVFMTSGCGSWRLLD